MDRRKMNETDLMKRISELWVPFQDSLDKYLLHGGLLDLERGRVIPIEEFNVKNCNPTESLINLMKSYRLALRLEEVCTLYGRADFDKTYGEEVERTKAIANKTIEQGEVFIRKSLERYGAETDY